MQDLSGKARTQRAQLLRQYIASLPAKRARIEDCWKDIQFSDWSADSLAKLKLNVHRLAGSAGSYGFEDLGSAAQTLESSLKSAAGSAEQRRVIGRQTTNLLQALAAIPKKMA